MINNNAHHSKGYNQINIFLMVHVELMVLEKQNKKEEEKFPPN